MAESSAQRPAFIQQQLAFAAHLRDPDNMAPPADVEERRLAIYRDLLYNNVEGFVSSAFPVLRAISDDATWHDRVRAFFREHRCQTPYFKEIATEFVEWLQETRVEHPDDPPFIQELSHYEWVELALSVSDADRTLPQVDPNGDLMTGRPLLSPLAWPLAYTWPVHQISPEFQPETSSEQPTYLVVNRDRLDKVHFLEVNPVTYRLLQLLDDEPHPTGRQALETIAAELAHPDPEAVITHGQALLNDLKARNILLGTRV